MVCVDFSLIGYDPKVAHLLAGIAVSMAADMSAVFYAARIIQ